MIIFLITRSYQGIWKRNINEGLELTPGETIKVNLNKSLSSYSRGRLSSKSPFVETSIKIDSQGQKEHLEILEDFQVKDCSKLTQIGKSTLSYFCKIFQEGNENEKNLLLIRNLASQQYWFAHLDEFETEHRCRFGRVFSDFEKKYFGSCVDLKDRNIILSEFKFDGRTKKLKIEKIKKIKIDEERFNLTKMRAEVVKTKTKGEKSINFFYMEIILDDDSEESKNIFFMYSILFTPQKISEKVIKTNLESLKLKSRGYISLEEFTTDGRDFIFLLTKRVKKDLLGVDIFVGNFKDSQIFHSFKTQALFSQRIDSKLNYDNRRYKVAKFDLFINIPRGMKGKPIYHEDLVILVEYRQDICINSYAFSKIPDKVYTLDRMQKNREKEVSKRIGNVGDIDIWDEVVLFKGVKNNIFNGKTGKYYSIWHTRIHDEVGTYPYAYSYPGGEDEEWELKMIDLYNEEILYRDSDITSHSYKKLVFLSSGGKIITKIIAPPTFEMKFKFKPGMKLRKEKVKTIMYTYEEGIEMWLKQEAEVSLTKTGGLLQLENERTFRFDTYKSFDSYFHLPKVIKGNAVKFDIEIEPKNTGIKLIHLNGLVYSFEVYKDVKELQEVEMITNNLYLAKLKKDFDYSVFYCKKLTFESDCESLSKIKLVRNSTIYRSTYSEEFNRIYAVLKLNETSYKYVRYSTREKDRMFGDSSFLEGYKIVDGMFYDGTFWFLGYKVGEEEKGVNFYEWEVFFSRSSIHLRNLTRITPDGISLNFTKILSISRVNSKSTFDQNYLVVLRSPYLSMFKLKGKKNSKTGILDRSCLMKYNSPLILEAKDPKVGIINTKWMSFLDKNLEKENNFINVRIKSTFRDSIDELGSFEIQSNYNKVFFNNSFEVVKDIRIFCGIGATGTCYAFFLGIKKKNLISNLEKSHQLAVLNLDHFEEASNKIIGVFEIKNFERIEKIFFQGRENMFKIQLKSKFSDISEFMMIMRGKVPLLHLDLSGIRESTSEGKVKIKARVENYLENEPEVYLEGVLVIHKELNQVKVKIPEKVKHMKFLDSKIPKEYKIEELLGLRGWVSNVELQKPNSVKNFIRKRILKIDQTEINNCLKKAKFKTTRHFTKIFKILKGNGVIFMISNTRTHTSSTQVFAIYKEENQCKIDRVGVPFQFLDSIIVNNNNLVIASKFVNNLLDNTYLMMTNIFYSKQEKSYRYKKYKMVVYSGSRFGSIVNLNRLGENRVILTVVKKREGHDPNTKRFTFMIGRVHDDGILDEIEVTKELETDNLICEQITQIESTYSKNNLILIVKNQFINKLLYMYLNYDLSQERGKRLKIKSWTYRSLSLNDDEDISEVGMRINMIKVDPEIIQSKTRLFLATENFQSYLFEVEFNNFFKIEKGEREIVKGRIKMIRTMKNPKERHVPCSVDLLENFVKIQYDYYPMKNQSTGESLVAIYDIRNKGEEESKRRAKLRHPRRITPFIVKKLGNMESNTVLEEVLEEGEKSLRLTVINEDKIETSIEKCLVNAYELKPNFILKLGDPGVVSLSQSSLKLTSLEGKILIIPLYKFFKLKNNILSVLLLLTACVLTLVLIFVLKKNKNNILLKEKLMENNELESKEEATLDLKDELDDSELRPEGIIMEEDERESNMMLVESPDEGEEEEYMDIQEFMDDEDVYFGSSSDEEGSVYFAGSSEEEAGSVYFAGSSEEEVEGDEEEEKEITEHEGYQNSGEEEQGEDEGKEEGENSGGEGEEEYYFEDDFMVEDYFKVNDDGIAMTESTEVMGRETSSKLIDDFLDVSR